MSNSDSEIIDFPNRNRLLRIANLSNFISWVTLGIFVLSAILNLLNKLSIDTLQYVTTVSVLLFEKPYYAVTLLFGTLRLIIQGIIYWLILKAVSLGLKMVVETKHNSLLDINGKTHGR